MSTTDLTDSLSLQARNASLSDLTAILVKQQDVKHDIVVPAAAITAHGGLLEVEGGGPDGPAGAAGIFRPTEVCDEGLAAKLQIPLAYLRRMRAERSDLYDANINGWLRGTAPFDPLTGEARRTDTADPDARRFLLRTFLDGGDGEGIARAFLSQSYKRVDNFDYLLAILDGAKAASAEVTVESCDLSERRMHVRLVAPEVYVIAEKFLARYRSPFNGRTGKDLPLISAGLIASNSETGNGAWSIIPRAVVQVCTNGLQRTEDIIRGVHVGARMDEGVVRWSEETQQKNLEMIRSQTRDAVATFLTVEYVERVIAGIEEQAAVPIANPGRAVEIVAQRMRYTEEQAAGILDHFIKGGDVTAGGILQAVTSYAQLIPDPDTATEFEATGLQALTMAASLADSI